ncbi:MAG TPA: hypothetical protein P5137_07830 [Candidatus Brocadiia bacterium]|nr:hypothetical protein [Candidatus Brocadiia bacterium]
MTRSQIFWAGFGGAVLVLLLVYIFVGGPARAELARQNTRWRQTNELLKVLEILAGNNKIPQEASVKEWSEFKTWLADQSQQAARFFADRDAEIERRLNRGAKDSLPGDFKTEYNDLHREAMRVIQSRVDKGLQVCQVFKQYGWMTSADALPNPKDYREIRKDFWIRRYFVLRLLLPHGVTAINTFRVGNSRGEPEIIPVPSVRDSEFLAIPVRVQCAMPADNVIPMLTTLLIVRETDQEKPFAILRELKIEKSAGLGGAASPPVNVEFLVDILDFEPKS